MSLEEQYKYKLFVVGFMPEHKEQPEQEKG